MPISDTAVPVLRSVEDVLDTAATIAASVAAGAVQREIDGTLPTDALTQISNSGLLGILVPASFGGPDLPAPPPLRCCASSRKPTPQSASYCCRTTF